MHEWSQHFLVENERLKNEALQMKKENEAQVEVRWDCIQLLKNYKYKIIRCFCVVWAWFCPPVVVGKQDSASKTCSWDESAASSTPEGVGRPW